MAEPLPLDHHTSIPEEDIDFIQDCRALLNQQQRSMRGALPWILIILVGSLIWWASWAELDEVTRGIGKVIPSKSVQLIQSLEGGILEEIHVAEGDQVEKGQDLLRIQDAIFAANYAENLEKLNELKARLARHQAETELFGELVFPEGTREDLARIERMLFEKRRADYLATHDSLDKLLKLSEEEQALLEERRDAISPIELIRVRKEIAEHQGNLETLRTKFERDAMEAFDSDNAQFLALKHAIERDKDRLRRTVISSPVRGTVNKIHIDTVGRVIGSGVDILEIVPLDDTLLVEANIRPSDIAFIRPGQKAMVKFTAYDFAVYGGLEGTVEHMSVDTITDEQGESAYQVKVRTKETTLGTNRRGENLEIMPGMVTEVDVITGRKTILHYLLKPLTRARERAMREH